MLLTFESEAINGKIPYVIPRQTMLIDIYIAALEKSEHKAEWNAFSRYLKTVSGAEDPRPERLPPGQQAGDQRVPEQVPGPRRRDQITSKVIGGWRAVDKKWFDPNEEHHAADRESLGVPTGLAPSPRRRGSRRRPAPQGEGLDGPLPQSASS